MLTNKKSYRIGLVELPEFELISPEGAKLNIQNKGFPLFSKQILLSNLQAGGFDAQLVNLQLGNDSEEIGTVMWRGRSHTKKYVGTKISTLDPEAYDAWGVTNNFTEYRELAYLVIKHLASGGKPIVAGGSDAIGVPHLYLQSGATAVVQDKSGAANWAIFDYLLGREPREKLTGVILADGSQYPKSTHSLSPEDWPIPSSETIQQCLGTRYWYPPIPSDKFTPVSSMLFDIGCDRTCDFCQTPTYGTGYRRMSPKKALQWAAALKDAGAKSFISGSDQFLGRVLFPDGREEVLEILNGLREMELPVSWLNGIELRKATKGHGRNYDNADLTPDEELIEAVWGWNGKAGCVYAYIPAERPVVGGEAYKKLLPWKQHCDLMRALVRSGVPDILYGVIIGLSDDNNDSLLYLEEAILELSQELKKINPLLNFLFVPLGISPLPGTPQESYIRQKGLLRFEDPAIIGGLTTICADTHHLSYEEVSDWQIRLSRLNFSAAPVTA